MSTPADNYKYDIPRISLGEIPDQTALNVAKVNNEITKENNKIIKSNTQSQLPPKVRLVNIINQNKVTIQKRLIPFIITLLMSFGEEVTQAIINKIPVDKLKNLVDCPSQNTISNIIKKRNNLVKQINNIFQVIKILTLTVTGLNVLIKVIEVAIVVAKANPYPSIGIPPAGLPPLTAGVQNTLADALRIAQEQNKTLNLVLDTVTITLASFGVLLGIILGLLNSLDALLQNCAQNQNMDLEAINNEINALSNPTVTTSQSPEGNIYKGFKLEVVINEKNTSKFIQRYAQAVTSQGVPVLKTEPSFASSPQILLDQLKFIIDSNPNITAE